MLIRRELFGYVDPKENNNIEKQEINVSCDPFKRSVLQVKKETLQLREFEEGLVSQYKFYLEDLEQTVKGTSSALCSYLPISPFVLLTIIWSDAVSDWKQKKQKRSQAVSLQSYKGLAEVAIRCICDLLVALPHFNFHNNIVVMVVPLMSTSVRKVSLLATFAGETQHLEMCSSFRCCDFALRCLRCVVTPSVNCWSRINWVRPH